MTMMTTRPSGRSTACRRVASILLALCALLIHPPVAQAAAGSGDPLSLLGERPRPGWSVHATRELGAAVHPDGGLRVQPSDRTRLFATAELTAAAGEAVDARPFAHLVFEVNTLPGAGGRHRAPELRVSLSDASGRSRQPLLSRYLRLDSDPATWQQALIPLRDLLDRDVDVGAIARVGWQFAGAAAPFAVRHVALLPPAGGGTSGGTGNLLADPSFEERADARPIWSTVGDYRDLAAPESRRVERGYAAHGRRFLRLRGDRAYFFEALAPRAEAVGFALALRDGTRRNRRADNAADAPRVEIGCEVVGFGARGGVFVAKRATRELRLETGWRRHAVSALVNVGDLSFTETGLRLYRAWVRPLDEAATVDVDAVHLAATLVDPDTFVETPANALIAGAGVFQQVRSLRGYRPLSDRFDQPAPSALQSDLPPFRIPLEAHEWAGRAWESAPITGGVPLPRGRLYSPDALRLRAPDGREIPFQSQVLRRDTRDGSVRCLWVAFRHPLRAGERLAFTLETGATIPNLEPPLVSEATDEVLINTGTFRMRLPRRSFPLFADAQWSGDVVPGGSGGIRLELLDGRVLTSLGPPTAITVERNGPVNAVVAVSGFLSDEKDRPAPRFFYRARLRAWKGAPGIQVDLAVTNLTPEPGTPVRSLALRVPLGRNRQAEATLARERGEPLTASLAAGQVARVTQRRDPFREGQEDLLVEVPEAEPTAQKGRVGGWASWRRAAFPAIEIAFARMADRHPAALEVRPEGLSAYLIPPTGSAIFSFPFGLTAYGEFWIGSGEAPDMALDRLQRPPLLRAEAAYVAAAGVFRPFPLLDELARDYPFLAGVLEREMAFWRDDAERSGETGWLNDGDLGSFGRWRHGDADSLESLYAEYLRTGDPRFWERARRQAWHQREVCVWWSNESSAFHNPGAGGLHSGYGLDPARLPLTGLLYDYWLTGDRRSLEVAEALGAELLSRAGYAHYRGVERGRLLLHLAELYGATGRSCFRQAYERHLGFGAPSETEGVAAGPALAALAEGVACIESPALADRLRRDLAALAARLPAWRPFIGLEQPDESLLYRALSYLPEGALSEPAREAALEHLLWFSLLPHTRDVSLARSVQALAPLAGAAPPRWAEGSLLGIGPFSGSGSRFTVRIHRAGKTAPALTLFRLRPGITDAAHRYRVRYELRDPVSKRLGREMLEGEALVPRTLSLPEAGLRGDYTLTVACEEEGIAEVVSAHPGVYLHADEWLTARRHQARASFYLRAPRVGEVRVAITGTIPPDGDNVFAAVLRAPSGEVIARARWSVPLAGTDAAGRAAARQFPSEPLRLGVPAAWRARPLRLEVTVPRGIAWRVEGLDEPWLAATAAAFP